MSISRRNFLKGAGLAGGTLALVGCGGGGGNEGGSEGGSSASGELIPVGIINNDPNESGYRTANDADMKNTFTEENGFAAEFAYSMKNEEQIASAQQFIQNGVKYLLVSAADTAGWTPPAGTPRSRTPLTPAPTRSCSTASSTLPRTSTSPPSSPTWTPRARPPLTG